MLNKYLEEISITKRAGLIPYTVDNNIFYIALMRPSDPKYGGTELQFAKGKVEDGDDFRTTAVKECEQELGLKISKESLHLLWDNKDKNIQWFFARLSTKEDLNPGPNENGVIESMDCQWIEIEKAEHIIRDWQRPIVRMLKRRLGI